MRRIPAGGPGAISRDDSYQNDRGRPQGDGGAVGERVAAVHGHGRRRVAVLVERAPQLQRIGVLAGGGRVQDRVHQVKLAEHDDVVPASDGGRSVCRDHQIGADVARPHPSWGRRRERRIHARQKIGAAIARLPGVRRQRENVRPPAPELGLDAGDRFGDFALASEIDPFREDDRQIECRAARTRGQPADDRLELGAVPPGDLGRAPARALEQQRERRPEPLEQRRPQLDRGVAAALLVDERAAGVRLAGRPGRVACR